MRKTPVYRPPAELWPLKGADPPGDAPAVAIATGPPRTAVELASAASRDDRPAGWELRRVLHEELRDLAWTLAARRSPSSVLEAPVVLRECYARLAEDPELDPDARFYFIGTAALALRQLLTEAAVPVAFDPPADLDSVDGALFILERWNPEAALIATFRYFLRAEPDEIAAWMDVHPAVVRSDWHYAQEFVRSMMTVRTEPL